MPNGGQFLLAVMLAIAGDQTAITLAISEATALSISSYASYSRLGASRGLPFYHLSATARSWAKGRVTWASRRPAFDDYCYPGAPATTAAPVAKAGC